MHHAILHISKLIQSNIELRNLRRYQAIQGKSINNCIGIHHEKIFIEGWIDTNNILDLMVNLKFQWIHRRVKVNLEYGTCQFNF